jgi:hypothetical protein
MDKDKSLGGYDSTRDGAWWDKYLFYILFTHFGYNE